MDKQTELIMTDEEILKAGLRPMAEEEITGRPVEGHGDRETVPTPD